MKKENVIKLFSMALALWYVLCVVGFNLHTCQCSGRSYVVSLLGETACADIHEDKPCHPVAESHADLCASESAGLYAHSAFSAKDCCCSNDVMLLGITGTDRHEQPVPYLHCSCQCDFCPYMEEVAGYVPQPGLADIPWPDISQNQFFVVDILAAYSVFRI